MRWAWLGLALVLAPAAHAQTVPPIGQTRADQALDTRLRLVTEALRAASERLADPAAATWREARGAVDGAQAMLADLPVDASQEAMLSRARTALSEAHDALDAASPDRANVARELREAAEAMATLRPGLGTIAPRMP